jgi:hexosaminidase
VKTQWQASSQVQAQIKELGLKDEDELQSWFVGRIGTFLAQHGRRLVGWDEILEGGLPAGATVMSWRGEVGGIAAAQKGHDVVMTPQTHLYFDHYQSLVPGEPLAIGGHTPLAKIYAYNPVPEVLTPGQVSSILGAQCNLWTEYIPTPEHLEYMLFPRALAFAEIAWTPRGLLDFTAFQQRLSAHVERLHRLHVNFRPL